MSPGRRMVNYPLGRFHQGRRTAAGGSGGLGPELVVPRTVCLSAAQFSVRQCSNSSRVLTTRTSSDFTKAARLYTSGDRSAGLIGTFIGKSSTCCTTLQRPQITPSSTTPAGSWPVAAAATSGNRSVRSLRCRDHNFAPALERTTEIRYPSHLGSMTSEPDLNRDGMVSTGWVSSTSTGPARSAGSSNHSIEAVWQVLPTASTLGGTLGLAVVVSYREDAKVSRSCAE